MSAAVLKARSAGRILAGHPWVYDTDIARLGGSPVDGEEVDVRLPNGDFVGAGFFNSRSRIRIRICSPDREAMDEAFLRRRISQAVERRRQMVQFGSLQDHSHRLVWSEADQLSGLIVDRYGDSCVIQTLSMAFDQRRDVLVKILDDLLKPRRIVERNDVGSRQLEGLETRSGILKGEPEGDVRASMGEIEMELDLLKGHKTGSYLDQISNHRHVARYAKGLKVLDCFTYQGGFALHAAKAGASVVEGWDISEAAITQARQNAAINGLKDIEWKTVNVFDELNARQKKGDHFDLIVLDPPSFTKTRAKLDDALRGYKEIHLRAMKLLKPGGMLATFCCSHHVDDEIFRGVILDAAFDARKRLLQRERFMQSPDHPILPAVPETEYLKGFLFQML